MADPPPIVVYSGGTLPNLLINCRIADFELDWLCDEAGNIIEPRMYHCRQILGFEMRKLPFALLCDFCMMHGLIVRNDADQNILLVSLATLRMKGLYQANKPAPGVDIDPPTSSDDEEEQESSAAPASQSNGPPPVNLEEQESSAAPASQSNGPPPVQSNLLKTILTANLDDVIITEDTNSEATDGTPVMIATTIVGRLFKDLKVDELRAFCSRAKMTGHRSKNKREIALLIAYSIQYDKAVELTGVAAKQNAQQRINMKFRLINACFTDTYYQKFVDVNKKKTRSKLDAGTAAKGKDFYTDITGFVNDQENNDVLGVLIFPENEHLSQAVTDDALDPNSVVLITWTHSKKLLSEVFKAHEVGREKFNTSGHHESDFYGDGFTQDLCAFYFYLHLQLKPDAFKSVSTTLDDGVFYAAGAQVPGGEGPLKRPPAALEKKEKKAARQTEANVRAASAIIQPIMETFCQKQKESEERREARVIQVQLARAADNAYNEYIEMGRTIDLLVSDLSKASPGVLYDHLESRIDESREERVALRAKSGRF
jgi:hypothetical protein